MIETEIANNIAEYLDLDKIEYRGDTGVSKMFVGCKDEQKINIKYTSGKIFIKDTNNQWIRVKNYFIKEEVK